MTAFLPSVVFEEAALHADLGSLMLKIKPGVRIKGLQPEIVTALLAAERIYEKQGIDLWITSGRDGNHVPGSKHYEGFAVDLRSRDLADPKATVAEIRLALGADFDVLYELKPVPHIHLEFDPEETVGVNE